MNSELIESDPHQAPNTEGKDRQVQLSSHKMNRWQAELATRFQKGGNSAIQTELNIAQICIIVERKENIRK